MTEIVERVEGKREEWKRKLVRRLTGKKDEEGSSVRLGDEGAIAVPLCLELSEEEKLRG